MAKPLKRMLRADQLQLPPGLLEAGEFLLRLAEFARMDDAAVAVAFHRMTDVEHFVEDQILDQIARGLR